MKTYAAKKAVSAMLSFILAFSTLCMIPFSTVSAVGTTYYVDSVGGNDTNSGTSSSSAWKTLGKVNTVTFSPGDVILLKAGSVWNSEYLDLKGSGSSGSPIVVNQYGTGAKPVINFGNTAVSGEGFGVRLKNVSYWEINNLEITSGQHSTDMRRNGVLVVGEGTGAGNFQHIYIKGVYVHDVFGTDRRTGGINFHARGTNTQPESTWNDVLIEGNTVINVADTGIQTMTDAYFNSSWTHQYDAFTNLIMRSNYVEKIHRDGILVRAGLSPLVEYNTTNKIGTYCTVDTSIVSYLDTISVVAAQWAYYTTGAIFQYNEGFDTKRINADGQPWDFDQFVHNSIYQYNYSHNNQGGTLLIMHDTTENTFRYNISQNDLDINNGVFQFIQGTGTVYVYNNVIYRTLSQNTALTSVSSSTSKVYYTNNIFYNLASGGYSTSSKAIYSNNLFYGTNASQPSDPNKITTDPLFVSPGGATSRATAGGYKLQSSSPAINSGISISGNGGKDFFGNTLYNSTPDRGAHEYSGSDPTPTPSPTPSPTPTPPPGTLLQDDFEDGDAVGWTTVGGSWSIATDGTKVYSQISTSGTAIAYAGDSSWVDYTYQAKVKLNSTNGNVGILFRYADASNFYMFRLNDNGNKVELYKSVGGTLTLLSSVANTVNTGQFYTLKAVVTGNNVKGYLDGVEKINWTNGTTQLSSGKIGFRMASSSAKFDDVQVTQ
ncbi:MAG TPA: family 16 glycoside hydrolase [Bacilli bacterium]